MITKSVNTAAVARALAGGSGTRAYERAKEMLDSAMRHDAEMVALRGEVARLQDQVARLEAQNMLLVGRLAAAAP